jgi:protein SCO1/2
MKKQRNIVSSVCICAGLLMALYTADGHQAGGAVDWSGVRVDEKLGKKIPGDAVFRDEHGNRVTIGDYVNKPTLVLPIYYQCPQSCGIMLGNLAAAMNDVPLVPGRDFRVLCLSFDVADDPSIALQAKKNYFKIIKKGFPDGDWKFLTGDITNIRRFTDAAGYHFKKSGRHDFIHPNVLIVLSRGRTIIRYLYGPVFLPFDIGMALTEATRGTPAISVRKLVSYCFSYEPKNKSYSFRAVQILSLGIFLIVGIVMFFLLRKKHT